MVHAPCGSLWSTPSFLASSGRPSFPILPHFLCSDFQILRPTYGLLDLNPAHAKGQDLESLVCYGILLPSVVGGGHRVTSNSCRQFLSGGLSHSAY
ncbi:hypothetical protein AVEN_261136-1 [Araneus ventricosus]|uniref:Uncharacterized protein n=1 Tax=Araneus ventricosus TaxID=182803 RepID=A0A4Y2IZK3_ARAVE|nr:hypothetical protein AVEN_261136-1 [Araneus ventricosus]